MEMKIFAQMVGELRATKSLNDKKAILAKYDDPVTKEILLYAMNPYMMFNITSKKLKDAEPGTDNLPWSMAKLVLDQLHKREVTGNAALLLVKDFLKGRDPAVQEIFRCIVDKDLDVGAGAKMVNAIWPKHIPQFEVQLCQSYEDLDKLPFKSTYVSRKLDGVRVVALKRDDKGFRFFSREGNEFTALDKVKAELDLFYRDTPTQMLDGEICIINEKGEEDFTAAVSQIKRKDFTIEKPKYLIFDALPLAEFDAGESKSTFAERYAEFSEQIIHHDTFSPLKQVLVDSPEDVQRIMANAEDLGWEGLIIRNGDAIYEGKRTKNLLKVKKFEEQEFTITGYREGTGQFTGSLGALVIEGKITNEKDKQYFGVHVVSECGSGFTHTDPNNGKDRNTLWAMREQLPGQIVTAQYFEVSENQNKDGFSLRFPTFKVLHGLERTT